MFATDFKKGLPILNSCESRIEFQETKQCLESERNWGDFKMY